MVGLTPSPASGCGKQNQKDLDVEHKEQKMDTGAGRSVSVACGETTRDSGHQERGHYNKGAEPNSLCSASSQSIVIAF